MAASCCFIDQVCPPTTIYAAFNNLRGFKEIKNYPDMGHATGPGWNELVTRWLPEKLNKLKGES